MKFNENLLFFFVEGVIPNIPANAKWAQNGVTVAGGNGKGGELNQLSSPFGIYVDDDQTVYIAESGNDRVVEWKSGAKSGQVAAGGNGKGNRANQLNSPVDVIFDKETDSLIISDQLNLRVLRWSRQNRTNGETIIENIDCSRLAMDDQRFLYVSDYKKHEVRQYRMEEKNGIVIAGGNGQGDRLNQLNRPSYIFVDQDYSVYVSEWDNHRVTKWMKGAIEGIVVAGGQGKGKALNQLSDPKGVIIDTLGTVYVVDNGNDRVMRWCKEAPQGNVIVGGNGTGKEVNQLKSPTGMSFDRHGNLYVVDYGNQRVQRFSIEK
ncbi:unnamed protein product [Rotaria sp. Silwood2]|nr:unnamed protein product [Rotaria sp. Silwood2]CAF4115470.1 unnamed protein product [Rotaria sp. Silwood2]